MPMLKDRKKTRKYFIKKPFTFEFGRYEEHDNRANCLKQHKN